MTRSEHAVQRARVAGSLAADDARETHRTVYPLRGRQTGRNAAQTRRYEPILKSVRVRDRWR